MLPKRKSPDTRRLLRAEVLRCERPSKHFVTLTLGGPELADFHPLGCDQWFRLFFRREGQRGVRLPTSAGNGWIAQCLLMSKASRPWVRNYTVRAFRPDTRELDIDFVVHEGIRGTEGTSPGSQFALRAEPGEEVGLFDEGISYLPPEGARQLIVADESGVPAALAILESAPAGLEATVLLEVPAGADIRPVHAPAGVDVRWLPRDRSGQKPGRLALDTLSACTLPAVPGYAWIAGESGLVTGARRHLTAERGMAKSDIAFLGYWKAGRRAPG